MVQRFCAGLLLWLAVVPCGVGAGEPVDYKPVKLEHALEAVIPQNLKHLAIENPQVSFHVLVGPDGDVADYLAVSATHVDLLDKAEEALQQRAEFAPATKDGVATTGKITVIVTFFDPEQRAWKQGSGVAPLGSNVSEALERRVYAAKADAYTLRESKPAELDAPITLLESKIIRVQAPDAAPAMGKVLVEYYIDHNGLVRLPEIVKSDDDSLSLSAIMSLKETRFAPPTRNSQPTYVRVRQPFNFD